MITNKYTHRCEEYLLFNTRVDPQFDRNYKCIDIKRFSVGIIIIVYFETLSADALVFRTVSQTINSYKKTPFTNHKGDPVLSTLVLNASLLTVILACSALIIDLQIQH